MRAAVMVSQGRALEIEEVTLHPPGPRDVRVRIAASGVCHTDLSVLHGLFPCPPGILGHEGVGIVEEVGAEVHEVDVGDRVIGTFVPSCGRCWFCTRGESFLCERGYAFLERHCSTRADGAPLIAGNGLGTFAEEMVVATDSVVKVASSLPDEQLALLGCAVTTGVGAVLNTAAVEAGSTAAVVGCGGIGQSVIQGLRIAGAARIIAIDPIASKRDHATRLGASEAVDPTGSDVIEVVKDRTGGRGADYVFDVVGSRSTVRQGYGCARRGGTVIVVGVGDQHADLALPGSLVVDAKRLCGCIYGSANVRSEFARLIALAENGLLDLGSMVSQTMPLERVNDALNGMETGSGIRTILTMGSN